MSSVQIFDIGNSSQYPTNVRCPRFWILEISFVVCNSWAIIFKCLDIEHSSQCPMSSNLDIGHSFRCLQVSLDLFGDYFRMSNAQWSHILTLDIRFIVQCPPPNQLRVVELCLYKLPPASFSSMRTLQGPTSLLMQIYQSCEICFLVIFFFF